MQHIDDMALKKQKDFFQIEVKVIKEGSDKAWKFIIISTYGLDELICSTAEATGVQEGHFSLVYRDFEGDKIWLATPYNLTDALNVARSHADILYLDLHLHN